jgi:hypothetical protein
VNLHVLDNSCNSSAAQISDKVSRNTTQRLRHLAELIYTLGPRPLFELLAEIVAGASPLERIERYGRLARDYGSFIRANGGSQFSSQIFVVRRGDDSAKD